MPAIIYYAVGWPFKHLTISTTSPILTSLCNPIIVATWLAAASVAISTGRLVCHCFPVSNVLWIPQPSCKQRIAKNSLRRKQHARFYKYPWWNVFCPQNNKKKTLPRQSKHTSLTHAQFPCIVTPASSAHSNPFGTWVVMCIYLKYWLGLARPHLTTILDFYYLWFPAQKFYTKRSGTMNCNQRRWT